MSDPSKHGYYTGRGGMPLGHDPGDGDEPKAMPEEQVQRILKKARGEMPLNHELRHSSLTFIRGLVDRGELRWMEHPWGQYAEVVGKGLMIHDDNDGVWSVWTKRYTIHVHTIGRDVAGAWGSLDWERLIARANKVNEWFSQTPDC